MELTWVILMIKKNDEMFCILYWKIYTVNCNTFDNTFKYIYLNTKYTVRKLIHRYSEFLIPLNLISSLLSSQATYVQKIFFFFAVPTYFELHVFYSYASGEGGCFSFFVSPFCFLLIEFHCTFFHFL